MDLITLTREPERYLANEEWTRELGGDEVIRTERWGPMTERRFILPSGLEVEFGVAPLRWAATDPVDPNLPPIIRDGFRVLYDPDGLLGDLVEACRR